MSRRGDRLAPLAQGRAEKRDPVLRPLPEVAGVLVRRPISRVIT
jgi:hypothetical protein